MSTAKHVATTTLAALPNTELWLIRHGESTGNRDGVLQGQEDMPLSDLGHDQAKRLAKRLSATKFTALYSSDLSRARQTAEYAAEALGLLISSDTRLREIDVGAWSGLDNVAIAERFPEEWAAWMDRDPELRRGGGESYAQAQKRVASAITDLARKHAGGRVAIVMHGGVIRAYIAQLLGLDLRHIWHLTIMNTSITRARPFAPAIQGGRRPRPGRIDVINDASHLETPTAIIQRKQSQRRTRTAT